MTNISVSRYYFLIKMSSIEGPEYHEDVAANKFEDEHEVSSEDDLADTVGAIEALDLNQGQDPFQNLPPDPFQNLPGEIMDIIFSYLDPASIKRVRLVSRLL